MVASALCYSQLLGQDKAKRLISKTLSHGRLPHGFLFRGPDGVGKRMYGRGLAAALNCRETGPDRACCSCSSCRKFISGSHPDFSVVEPDKGAIKIGQVRSLIQEVSYPPYESKTRVVVLEDVHTMRREAANSLLKTLEEPPEGNLFILTADSSRDILPTITSRCQVIPFVALDTSDTCSVLSQCGVEEKDSRILARLSGGSPGDAITLHRLKIVDLFKEVVVFLSDTSVDVNRDVVQLLSLTEKTAALKDELPTFLGLLKRWVRDLLLDEDEIMDLIGSSGTEKQWSRELLFDKMRALERAELELIRNCNKNLVCEVLFFKLQ